jgi:hypothetical protein
MDKRGVTLLNRVGRFSAAAKSCFRLYGLCALQPLNFILSGKQLWTAHGVQGSGKTRDAGPWELTSPREVNDLNTFHLHFSKSANSQLIAFKKHYAFI